MLSFCACSECALPPIPTLDARYAAVIEDRDSFFLVFPSHRTLRTLSKDSFPASRICYFAFNTGSDSEPYQFVRLSLVKFADARDPFKVLPSCSCGSNIFYVEGPIIPSTFEAFTRGIKIEENICLHARSILSFLRSHDLLNTILSFNSCEFLEPKHLHFYGHALISNPLPFKGFSPDMLWTGIFGGLCPQWSLVRIDPSRSLTHCFSCTHSKTRCQHAKAALKGAQEAGLLRQVPELHNEDVEDGIGEGEDDENFNEEGADLDLTAESKDDASLPSWSLLDPSPLQQRQTGLHFPMRPSDPRYPPERSQIFERLFSPFNTYSAQCASASAASVAVSEPPPSVRLISCCLQCRQLNRSSANDPVSSFPAASRPGDTDASCSCWILDEHLIFPGIYNNSMCPIHHCKQVVDGFAECIIQVTPTIMISEPLLDSFIDFLRHDGAPSFNSFSSLLLDGYYRNLHRMPWFHDRSVLEQLRPRLRALVEKVVVCQCLLFPASVMLSEPKLPHL